MARKKSPYPAVWSDKAAFGWQWLRLFSLDAAYTTSVYDPEFHRIKIYMAQLQPKVLNS